MVLEKLRPLPRQHLRCIAVRFARAAMDRMGLCTRGVRAPQGAFASAVFAKRLSLTTYAQVLGTLFLTNVLGLKKCAKAAEM